MTIAITTSGISLDGPLVAGEKVAVSVSGLSLAAEDKPTLALLARFPDALLASAELAEDADAPGTWTGELDTATKQTALFFATARADERRDAALELVAGRVSLARLTVPMANSALCPKPDGSPFASPVYVPVPGPPGTGGDPYNQAPEMDGEASPGTVDEYARGDHRHPTDTSRMAASATGVDIKAGGDVGNISIAAALTQLDEDLGGKQDTVSDLAAIRSGAAAGATAVQPAALSAYRTAAAQDAIDGAQEAAIAAKYTKPSTGIPASDLASGVVPTALPNPQPLHVGSTDYDGSTEEWVQNGDTNGGYGIVTLESATNSTHEVGYAATPLAVKTVADSVAGKADSASLAPAFSASSTYAVGAYCTHDGLLYRCTSAVSTAGDWNASDWTAVCIVDEMGADAPLPFDAECEYVASPADGGCGISPPYYCYISGSCDCAIELYIPAGSNSSDCFSIGAWKNVNCCCLFANSGTATQFRYDSSNVANGTYATDTWQTLGFVGTTVYCGSSTSSFTRRSFSDTTANFGVGLGKNIRIRRIRLAYKGTDIFDARPVRVGQIGAMYDVVSGKIFYSTSTNNLVPGRDKATPTITTPGRIVELTNSPAFTGTPTAPTAAAGTNTTQIATTAFVQTAVAGKADAVSLRYAFASPTPSVSGTGATVACEDRAINDFTVATGITSLTITPPAAVTGRARDFFCRVTLTDSSLPTVTLSGGTIDIGSTEVAGMTQGVNLLMFTEIASGHWLASRRSAS